MAKNERFRRHGSRFKARSRAVQILFEAEARDVDPVATVQDRRELSRRPEPVVPPVNEYTATIVEGVAVDLDGIDALIASHLAEEWSLERIPAVDRAILRVACWELIRNPEVPIPAVVVSAIELAESFSTTVAPPYINGVLDTIGGIAEAARAGETDPFAIPESPFADTDVDDAELGEDPFGPYPGLDEEDSAAHGDATRDAFGVDVDSVLDGAEWDEPSPEAEQVPLEEPQAAPVDEPNQAADTPAVQADSVEQPAQPESAPAEALPQQPVDAEPTQPAAE